MAYKNKEDQRKFAHEHYIKNKQYYLDKAHRWSGAVRKINAENMVEYLHNHPCVDCGEKDIVVLEFDHVRGVKSRAVSKIMWDPKEWSVVLKEIEKCDVRCANCHRRVTAKRGNHSRYALLAQQI